jgi:hypothetical protein
MQTLSDCEQEGVVMLRVKAWQHSRLPCAAAVWGAVAAELMDLCREFTSDEPSRLYSKVGHREASGHDMAD